MQNNEAAAGRFGHLIGLRPQMRKVKDEATPDILELGRYVSARAVNAVDKAELEFRYSRIWAVIQPFEHIPKVTVQFHLSNAQWEKFKDASGEVRLGWLEKVRRLLMCQDLGIPGGWDIMFSWEEPSQK